MNFQALCIFHILYHPHLVVWRPRAFSKLFSLFVSELVLAYSDLHHIHVLVMLNNEMSHRRIVGINVPVTVPSRFLLTIRSASCTDKSVFGLIRGTFIGRTSISGLGKTSGNNLKKEFLQVKTGGNSMILGFHV